MKKMKKKEINYSVDNKILTQKLFGQQNKHAKILIYTRLHFTLNFKQTYICIYLYIERGNSLC